ncbi:unnamed protein product [Orchesella dallaii]|uniref:Chitin-binding type-2 domain-containing protein n=1 Tax=Orchesella dallaii TaxID=48710 RepID=A0ABP1QJG7_9HEXA
MLVIFQFRRPCFTFLLLITAILNECGRTTVVARTWPRMKSYGKIYEKKSLFSANTTTSTAATITPLPETGEGNSLNVINSRTSLSDYKLLNRSTSGRNARCNTRITDNDLRSSYSHPSEGKGEQKQAGNGKWTNENNCIAGPFHFEKDVNESVYKKLCPSPNGIFSVPGTCNLYVECSDGQFTLNKCDPDEPNFDEGHGKCSKTKPKPSCSDDLGNEIEKLSLSEILRRIILFISRIATFARSSSRQLTVDEHQTGEETRLIPSIQSLDDHSDFTSSTTKPVSSNPTNLRNINDQLENMCKSPSSTHGIHPHPKFCSKFIQCGAPGTFYLKSCGPGTVFNSKLSICDWPSNVPHCVLSTDGTYITATGQAVGNELLRRRKRSASPVSHIIAEDNVHFPLSHKSLMTRKKRDVESSSSSSKEKCDSENYITPDPIQCNKYRICSNGRFVSVTCGEGTLFNPLKSVCDFADDVDCKSRRQDFGTYGCETGDAYQAPHPDSCNKFVECENGILAIKTCPPGTLYERDEARCEHAYRVTCRKPISLEHDVDVNFFRDSESREKSNSSEQHHHQHKRSIPIYWRASRSSNFADNDNKLNLACEFNYIAPHPTICNRFVECENKRIFIKTCGPGTAYNPILGQCDWPSNIREPDENHCTKYRICKGSLYQSASCGNNQVFHPDQRKCVSASMYLCPNAITTTTPSEPDYYSGITPPPA